MKETNIQITDAAFSTPIENGLRKAAGIKANVNLALEKSSINIIVLSPIVKRFRVEIPFSSVSMVLNALLLQKVNL